ncbi:MAG TPA: hypothetical protein DDZ80_03475 [Cyanobacteria bacterium UBA8803]|nr:hypothetical protein [Cyanobacteria bacterium UBA9273]HBL57631.1 hypothetical protein [Cyanobacteria bacterium UBA8803]
MIVFIDSGVLGILANPNKSGEASDCEQWLYSLLCSIDIDIIICTQWQIIKEEFPGRYIVIATTNVKHLSRFAEAKLWRDIKF